MKTLFLVFAFFSATTVWAESLSLPADISTVVSFDGKYDAKYSNAVRERLAVRNALGGEGSQIIILEKFAPGREGSEDKIITAGTYVVSELPGIKEYISNISKKSAEATYGCCKIENIKRVGTAWTFNAKHDAISFKCKSKEESPSKITISCSK